MVGLVASPIGSSGSLARVVGYAVVACFTIRIKNTRFTFMQKNAIITGPCKNQINRSPSSKICRNQLTTANMNMTSM